MTPARLGLAVAVGLRFAIAAMLATVIRAGPADHRFAGKGIAVRFIGFALPASMLVPAIWTGRHLRPRLDGPTGAVARYGYPAWFDSLYVSIFALDLAGNVFDLYDRHAHFDLVSHAHGGGAIAVTGAWLFGWSPGMAAAASIAGHGLLEAQEIGADVAFGFRNVRGWWDVAGDLGAGVAGAVLYAAAYERWVRNAGHEPASLLRATERGRRRAILRE